MFSSLHNMAAASPLLKLLKTQNSKPVSYGTFSCNSQTTLLPKSSGNNLDKVAESDEEDTTLDKCWRQCERLLMYFSAITVDKELEQLELENNNR